MVLPDIQNITPTADPFAVSRFHRQMKLLYGCLVSSSLNRDRSLSTHRTAPTDPTARQKKGKQTAADTRDFDVSLLAGLSQSLLLLFLQIQALLLHPRAQEDT